jgi:hypothetical protein
MTVVFLVWYYIGREKHVTIGWLVAWTLSREEDPACEVETIYSNRRYLDINWEKQWLVVSEVLGLNYIQVESINLQ